MKIRLSRLFLLTALTLGLGLLPVRPLAAQSLTNLHSFDFADGAYPFAGVVVSGNMIYGVTQEGGTSGLNGTIFALTTNGTGFSTLHNFASGFPLGPEGSFSSAALTLAGSTLYGTAETGGGSNAGTLFTISTNGQNFSLLHTFAGAAGGAGPYDGLIISGGNIYGTTEGGGNFAEGMVFALATGGAGFTNLHSFSAIVGTNLTNLDGTSPAAGLVTSGGVLFGTATYGGAFGNGTLFRLNTDGTAFTNLHSFSAVTNSTNADGIDPVSSLLLSGNALYGTASEGGLYGAGTVFKLNTDGSGFANLHNFTLPTGSGGTNADGAVPRAGLVISGSTLYGTAAAGGRNSEGVIFAINTDGTGFTNLHNFAAVVNSTNNEGASPFAPVTLMGNTLFGTAAKGGATGYGTVFSLMLGAAASIPPPQLSLSHAGSNIILSWPSNATTFTLQSTTNPVPPAVWSTVSPPPVYVGGQNVVTNSLTGVQKFYRLTQ